MGLMQRSLAAAVEGYILGRTGLQPISTADAVLSIKRSVSAVEATDREIADLVAIVAVRNGRAVKFDPIR